MNAGHFKIDRRWIGWIDGICVVAFAWRDVNSDNDWASMWVKVFVPHFSVRDFDAEWHGKLVAFEDFLDAEYFRPIYGCGCYIQLPTQFLPKGSAPDVKTGPDTGLVPGWKGTV